MKRALFNIVLTLMPVLLPGQTSLHTDTIHINEVVIRNRKQSPLVPGYTTSSVDSSVLRQYGSMDIADVLSDYSAVLIKSYGTGGIATPTFRGTASGHTQITWNNININNPMTGQFDLSLVPAGFVDRVDIYSGGGSMGINSGGLGGIINLGSEPVWDNRFSLTFNPSAGSFGKYAGLVRLNAGSSKIQTATKILHQAAENNFPYINTATGEEGLKETRRNNQLRQSGFQEEIFLKVRKGILSAKFWYQSVFRNLPEPIISMQGKLTETQRDESFRTVVNYSHDKGSKTLNLTGAFINDYLNYRNSLSSINSQNNAERIIIKGEYGFLIGSKTRIRTDFNEELNIIKTNNYSGNRSENIASAGAEAVTRISDRLLASLLLRENIIDNRLLIPDFSIAAQFKVVPEREYFISANFSRNSRIPSLNDLYWVPGGNPALKSETGYTSELIFSAAGDLSPSIFVKADLTVYHTRVMNMIRWQPGNFSYWEAVNIGSIISSGLESSFRLSWSSSGTRISADAKYILTHATDMNSGGSIKQLPYIPVSRLNGILRIDREHFFSRIVANCSSRRYTTADNSQFLPGYCVNDLDLGIKLNLKRTWYEVSLDMMNIFNISYQSIAWYPMPGRAILLSMIFQFKK